MGQLNNSAIFVNKNIMVLPRPPYHLIVVVDSPPNSQASLYFNHLRNQSQNGSIGDSLQDEDSWTSTLETFGMSAICVLGLLGNMLVSFTLIRRKQLKYPSNRLVLSLNISGLIFCLLVLPFNIANAVTSSSRAEYHWQFGEFWCQIVAFLSLLTTSVCSPTIALIAMDRYVAIVRPMVYTHLVTIQRSTLMAAAAWFMSLLVSLPPLFEFSRFDFVPSENACNVNWSYTPEFTFAYLFITAIAPLLVMLYCYSVIFQVALKKCQRINIGLPDSLILSSSSLTSNSPVILTSNQHPLTLTTKEDESMRRPQRVKRSKTIHTITGTVDSQEGKLVAECTKVTPRMRSSSSMGALASLGRFQNKMSSSLSNKRPSFTWIQYQSPRKGFLTILLLLGSFCLTWLPISAHAIMQAAEAASVGPNRPTLPDWFHSLANWLLVASFATHPVLYGLMNRAIRNEMWPAMCPPENRALRGLPRKNSQQRRVSGGQTFGGVLSGWDFPNTLQLQQRKSSPPAAVGKSCGESSGESSSKDLLKHPDMNYAALDANPSPAAAASKAAAFSPFILRVTHPPPSRSNSSELVDSSTLQCSTETRSQQQSSLDNIEAKTTVEEAFPEGCSSHHKNNHERQLRREEGKKKRDGKRHQRQRRTFSLEGRMERGKNEEGESGVRKCNSVMVVDIRDIESESLFPPEISKSFSDCQQSTQTHPVDRRSHVAKRKRKKKKQPPSIYVTPPSRDSRNCLGPINGQEKDKEGRKRKKFGLLGHCDSGVGDELMSRKSSLDYELMTEDLRSRVDRGLIGGEDQQDGLRSMVAWEERRRSYELRRDSVDEGIELK